MAAALTLARAKHSSVSHPNYPRKTRPCRVFHASNVPAAQRPTRVQQRGSSDDVHRRRHCLDCADTLWPRRRGIRDPAQLCGSAERGALDLMVLLETVALTSAGPATIAASVVVLLGAPSSLLAATSPKCQGWSPSLSPRPTRRRRSSGRSIPSGAAPIAFSRFSLRTTRPRISPVGWSATTRCVIPKKLCSPRLGECRHGRPGDDHRDTAVCLSSVRLSARETRIALTTVFRWTWAAPSGQEDFHGRGQPTSLRVRSIAPRRASTAVSFSSRAALT